MAPDYKQLLLRRKYISIWACSNLRASAAGSQTIRKPYCKAKEGHIATEETMA